MVTDINGDLFLIFQHFFQRLFVQRLRFIEVFFQQGKQDRVEHDGDNGAGKYQVLPGLRQQIQRHSQTSKNKGEFTDLRQTGGNGQGSARRVAEHPHQEEGGSRFTENDDSQRRQYCQRLLKQNHRVEQHSDGDKEQHGEGVAQRQRIVGRAMAELGFIEHHTGEKGAEGEGDVK
ncbi:hypothetical protein HMPREF3178_21005 [Klebsiella sp. HMSC09D12]|nr:hypothetical protein HMPREF3178_21005 [Klebsiella sp. HMSC09D12]